MAQVVARVTPQKLVSSAWQQWISGIDAFLLDCDGVLWRGDAAIPGAHEMIALMRSLGKRVVFVTNNSTKSRDTYVKKLASQGIPATVDEIVTSAWATVAYMKNEKIAGKVYYVGEAGLGQELKNEGYEAFGLEHGDVKDLPNPFTVDHDVKAVVVGLDRNISYYKLAYATACVRQIPGCRFIGTNPDPTFPVDGAILPGGGTLVKTIECAVGRAPEAVVGKPSQDLLKTVLATYNLDPARTCMVGDRLSTDIAFGRLGGLQTLLVLTGVTHESELADIELPEFVPHHYVQSVDVLNQLHKKQQQ
jgi:phosphoglycolate/pyridoxal phosphate phosphatase family enzyme